MEVVLQNVMTIANVLTVIGAQLNGCKILPDPND